jgi:hypothetical protein
LWGGVSRLRHVFFALTARFPGQLGLLKSAHSLAKRIRHSGGHLASSSAADRAYSIGIRPRADSAVSSVGCRGIRIRGAGRIRNGGPLPRLEFGKRGYLQHDCDGSAQFDLRVHLRGGRNESDLARFDAAVASRQARKFEFAGLVRPAHPHLVRVQIRQTYRCAGNAPTVGGSDDSGNRARFFLQLVKGLGGVLCCI